jgi:hypothetical protein
MWLLVIVFVFCRLIVVHVGRGMVVANLFACHFD